MKTNILLLLVACVAAAESVAASSKTAFASATSLSLVVQPYSRNVAGLGTVTTYFTTYDGSSGTPWHDVLPDGSWVFSSEFRPRSGVPGDYEDDYLAVNLPNDLWSGVTKSDVSKKSDQLLLKFPFTCSTIANVIRVSEDMANKGRRTKNAR